MKTDKAATCRKAKSRRVEQRRRNVEERQLRAENARLRLRLFEAESEQRRVQEELAFYRSLIAEESVLRIAGDLLAALVKHEYSTWRDLNADVAELKSKYETAIQN